jgi:hypothetical protein
LTKCVKAELARERFARRIQVDSDDHVGADHLRALHDVEADAAETEDDDVRAGLHFRGVDDRADARRHAAADVADLVEWRVLADLRERDLRQHGEVREGRAPHVMEDRLAVERKAAAAVRHQAFALRRPDRRAKVRLARQARLALPALGRVERNDVIALLERRDAGPDVDDDARAFVPEDRREESLRVRAGAGVFVGVADARGLDLDQHLACLRSGQVDHLDGQGGSRLVRNRRPDFHRALLRGNRKPRL